MFKFRIILCIFIPSSSLTFDCQVKYVEQLLGRQVGRYNIFLAILFHRVCTDSSLFSYHHTTGHSISKMVSFLVSRIEISDLPIIFLLDVDKAAFLQLDLDLTRIFDLAKIYYRAIFLLFFVFNLNENLQVKRQIFKEKNVLVLFKCP